MTSMASPQPRLREDLIVMKRAGAERSYIIKDPLSERFFRAGEPEIFLARQLGGATPLEDIRLRTEQEFGAPLPSKSLEIFVQRLERLGFLESQEEGVGAFGPNSFYNQQCHEKHHGPHAPLLSLCVGV
jgi:hypothetical protein